MRRPSTIECLYLDFDGFFASVEQRIHPALRGKPVGVTPFKGDGNRCVIACSKEAKAAGVSNVMSIEDAKARCPDLILTTVQHLYETDAKQMRKLWRSVSGERLWYALHGYAIQTPDSKRGMFGHGRILPPDSRSLPRAREVARFLLIKAARRLRREHFYAAGLHLHVSLRSRSWSRSLSLPVVHDDQALLAGLQELWRALEKEAPKREQAFKVGVHLYDLSPADVRQLDFLLQDDADRMKWERINTAVDALNGKYGKTVASLGFIPKKNLDNVGGKISFTRIPSREDFW